jgi:hypothetical protein
MSFELVQGVAHVFAVGHARFALHPVTDVDLMVAGVVRIDVRKLFTTSGFKDAFGRLMSGGV